MGVSLERGRRVAGELRHLEAEAIPGIPRHKDGIGVIVIDISAVCSHTNAEGVGAGRKFQESHDLDRKLLGVETTAWNSRKQLRSKGSQIEVSVGVID